MSKRDDRLARYYDLLSLFEDYVATGFRRAHPVVDLRTSSETERETENDSRAAALEKTAAEVTHCTRCNLCHNRLKAVPGEGVLDPAVMVIGEAPGGDEDKSGRPFVGAAGQYLDKWLAALGLSRETNAFIANIVKCRPPENRDPRPEETAACLPFLESQITIIRPRAILAVGRVSSQTLLSETRGIGALRGGSYFFHSIPLVPTYHPSAVLRDLSLKAPVWEDLKRLKALIDHA